MEHAGSAGGCAWKDKLKQDGDKAGGKRRGNDAADNVVGRRGVLVLGPVDLESSDLGALGPLGSCETWAFTVPVMRAFLPRMSLSAQTSTSPSTVPSMVTVSPASAADLAEPRRATVSPAA